MLRHPPRSSRTASPFPYTPLFRSASLRHVRCAYGRPCPDRGEKAWRPARRGDNVCRRRNGSGGIVRSALMKALLSTIPGGPETLEQIGRAHVCTPVTNAQLVCRLLLEKKNTKLNTLN